MSTATRRVATGPFLLKRVIANREGKVVITPVKTGRSDPSSAVSAVARLCFRFARAVKLTYILWGCVFAIGWVSSTSAQTVGRESETTRPTVPSTTSNPLPIVPLPLTPSTAATASPEKFPIPASVINLPDGKGGVISVPADANIERFLEWLKQERLRNARNAEGPTASVTAVEFEGQSDDQMATLSGRLTVQIAGDQFPLSYAIGLGESVFRRKDVKGPGQVIFGGRDRERGYVWWFDKPGEYEFNLELTVPLLKASPWRRLQLSVPNSPVTSLRLEVPSGNVIVKAPEDVIQTSRPLDEQRSEIRAAGFGGKVEILSWQPTVPATEGATGLDVNSNIAVRSTSDAFLLEATQFLRPLQGTFREFTVALPSRGELLSVDGNEISESRADETDPERISVLLKSPTAGTISVRWQVRVPQLSRRNFDLDGFRVEGARRESGEIGFLAAEGFRWNVADGSDPHVERMNAGEFRIGGVRTTAVRACRFFSQPFRLPTTLDPVEPYYDVATLFALSAAEKQIHLEARFKVHIYRGQLPELSIEWPGWQGEGWKLDGPQANGAIVTSVTADDDGGKGRIVVSLAERSNDEPFEWRLRAHRDRKPDEDASISLPRMLAPAGSPTRLVLLSDENIDAHLIPRGETVLRPYVPQPTSTETVTFPTTKRPQSFRIDTDERTFRLGIQTQQQQITVASEVSGTLTSQRLELQQKLLHRVEYARLNEIKLSVPVAIFERIKFYFAGQLQTPQWSDGVGGREKIATITLPEPLIGEVALDAAWSIPLPKDLLQDKPAAMPLTVLRSLSGTTTSQRLRIEQPAWLELSLVEPSWHIEHADDDEVVWSNTLPTEPMTLRVVPTTEVRGVAMVVRKAVARVHVDRGGVQHSRFEIELNGAIRQLHVQLPKAALAGVFLWNDVPLPADSITEVPQGSGRFSLSLPDSSPNSTGDRLVMEYRLPTTRTLGWSTAQTLSVPVLPQCRWMADIAWDVSIPNDQHLLSYPESATPWFHWERSGVIWRRISPALVSGSSGRIGPSEAAAAASHTYAFGQFGTLNPFAVRCISTPAALAWGAGATFIIGLVLLKLPRLPAMYAVGFLSIGMLIAALWFLPQIELLIQPMLVGLAFPLTNALFGWWRRRSFPSTVLTINASPSEVQSRSGSLPATQSLRALHPDSATVYRPQIVSDQPSVRVTAESHLG